MKVRRVRKVVGNIVFYAVIIALIAVSCIMIKAKKSGVQPSIFGYKFYVVLTGSMTPTIAPGDLVIVKDVEPSQVKTGDIITFASANSKNITTHRVQSVKNDKGIEFVTKGDANNVTDLNPVAQKYLIGRVVSHVDKIGIAMQSIQNHLMQIVIIILAVGVLLFVLVNVVGGNKKKQKEEGVEIND